MPQEGIGTTCCHFYRAATIRWRGTVGSGSWRNFEGEGTKAKKKDYQRVCCQMERSAYRRHYCWLDCIEWMGIIVIDVKLLSLLHLWVWVWFALVEEKIFLRKEIAWQKMWLLALVQLIEEKNRFKYLGRINRRNQFLKEFFVHEEIDLS